MKTYLLPALAMLAACGDSTGSNQGPVRIRSLEGNALVLYSAPPLREVRRVTLASADTLVRYAGPAPDGGFYVFLDVPGSPTEWLLARYDGSWSRVATRRRDAMMADSFSSDRAHLTPDGSLLVLQALFGSNPPAGMFDLLVLDPLTLELVRRVPAGNREFLFGGPGPSAATGTEVLWRNDPQAAGCSRSLVWFDVAALTVTDSVQVPCTYSFRGARTTRQLYLWDQQMAEQRLKLVNITSGQVLASAPDTLPSFLFVADNANGQLVVTGGGLVLLDAVTLALRDIILFQVAGAPPAGTDSGVIDPVSGHLVALTAVPRPVEQGFGVRYFLGVVDLERRRIISHEEIPAAIVPLR